MKDVNTLSNSIATSFSIDIDPRGNENFYIHGSFRGGKKTLFLNGGISIKLFSHSTPPFIDDFPIKPPFMVGYLLPCLVTGGCCLKAVPRFVVSRAR